MATYGIEIEFPTIRATRQPLELNAFGKAEKLFIIRSAVNNRPLYTVVTDMANQGSNLIECISSVHGDQGDADNIFESLTLFLDWLRNKNFNVHAGGRRWYNFNPADDIAYPAMLGANYNVSPAFTEHPNGFYISWPLNGINKTILNNLSINPQASFGFRQNTLFLQAGNQYNNTTVLQRLCTRYSAFLMQGISGIDNINGINGINSYFRPHCQPYSEYAKELFDAYLLIHNVGGLTEVWNERWPLIELLRYILAYSFKQLNEVQVSSNGYKAYLNILNRVSFSKNTLRSIFNFSFNDIDSRHTIAIRTYIKSTFYEDIFNMTPFSQIYENGMIANNGVVQADIANELNNLTADKLICSALVTSQYPDRLELADTLDRQTVQDALIVNLEQNRYLNPYRSKQYISVIRNNIITRDLVSPLPYSYNSDAMGYYSRSKYDMYTGRSVIPPLTPHFFFEIRNFKLAVRRMKINMFGGGDPGLLTFAPNIMNAIIALLNEARMGINHEGWFVPPLE